MLVVSHAHTELGGNIHAFPWDANSGGAALWFKAFMTTFECSNVNPKRVDQGACRSAGLVCISLDDKLASQAAIGALRLSPHCLKAFRLADAGWSARFEYGAHAPVPGPQYSSQHHVMTGSTQLKSKLVPKQRERARSWVEAWARTSLPGPLARQTFSR